MPTCRMGMIPHLFSSYAHLDTPGSLNRSIPSLLQEMRGKEYSEAKTELSQCQTLPEEVNADLRSKDIHKNERVAGVQKQLRLESKLHSSRSIYPFHLHWMVSSPMAGVPAQVFLSHARRSYGEILQKSFQ